MSPRSRPRILVIDDDPSVRDFASYTLTSAGFRVTCAIHGREGLFWAQESTPRLILLDLVLPDLNGIEVLRLLKSSPQTRSVPVMILTGMPDCGFVLKSAALSLGAARFVQKPFGHKTLLNSVGQVLEMAPLMNPKTEDDNFLERGPLRVDLLTRTVYLEGRSLGNFPTSRYTLLCALLSSEGYVSKLDLMRIVDEENKNTLEKAIQRLRSLIGEKGHEIIKTVPGGYLIPKS